MLQNPGGTNSLLKILIEHVNFLLYLGSADFNISITSLKSEKYPNRSKFVTLSF